MPTLDELQADIGDWARKTFPQATDTGTAMHLQREVSELLALCHVADFGPIGADINMIAEESADCLILLLNLANRIGFSLADAVTQKMQVNRARQWGQPDAEGVVEHIRAGKEANR